MVHHILLLLHTIELSRHTKGLFYKVSSPACPLSLIRISDKDLKRQTTPVKRSSELKQQKTPLGRSWQILKIRILKIQLSKFLQDNLHSTDCSNWKQKLTERHRKHWARPFPIPHPLARCWEMPLRTLWNLVLNVCIFFFSRLVT